MSLLEPGSHSAHILSWGVIENPDDVSTIVISFETKTKDLVVYQAPINDGNGRPIMRTFINLRACGFNGNSDKELAAEDAIEVGREVSLEIVRNGHGHPVIEWVNLPNVLVMDQELSWLQI